MLIPKQPTTWIRTELDRVPSAETFFGIMTLLEKEHRKNGQGMWGNRVLLLEAFRSGNFYGLKVLGKLSAYCKKWEECTNELPCFAVMGKNKNVEFIWVHKDLRRHCLATDLIRLLEVQNVPNEILTEDGLKFFQALVNRKVLKPPLKKGIAGIIEKYVDTEILVKRQKTLWEGPIGPGRSDFFVT